MYGNRNSLNMNTSDKWLLGFLLILCTVLGMLITANEPKLANTIRVHKIQILDTLNFVRITSYQAVPSQTDAHPLEPASMIPITKDMYWNKESYGYCAVSRDLLYWKFNMLDTIYCHIEGKEYGFIIFDTMNSRYYNSIDILTKTNFAITTKVWYKR